MMRKKRSSKISSPKVFRPPKSKYFLITLNTILVLLTITGLIILFLWLFRGSFFKVENIDCVREEFGCSSEENSLLESLYGQNIFLLKTRRFSQEFLKKQPRIAQVRIIKKIPNSLRVILTVRRAIAILQTEKESLLVDTSGFVFENKEDFKEKLPIIILPHSIAAGERLEGDKEKKAILLVKKLQESFIQFDQIDLRDKNFLEVVSSGKMIATFSGEKKISLQVDSLQYILHHSRINEKVIKVDLRFDKPILVVE